MTFIISIANQKGGVGKTTTTVNLSAALAASQKCVLVVDLDPQGNTTTALGHSKDSCETIYEALSNKRPLAALIRKTMVPGLDLVASSLNLAGAEIELSAAKGREKILKGLLTGLAYDYIFIDCPPALGLLTINALASSSSLIIPLQCEYYALEGLSQIIKTVKLVNKNINPALQVLGILLTMFDSRNSLSRAIEQEVRDHFSSEVFNSVIPRNVRVSEAPSHGLPVLLYDFKSAGAQAYVRLACEVIKKCEEVAV